MKAFSVGWELSVILSQEEISRLFTEKIKGKILVRDRDQIIGRKNLEIVTGEIDKNLLYLELKTEPDKVYIDKVEKYFLILSLDGYFHLKCYGCIRERMLNGYSNIDLMNRSYYEKEVRMFEM